MNPLLIFTAGMVAGYALAIVMVMRAIYSREKVK